MENLTNAELAKVLLDAFKIKDDEIIGELLKKENIYKSFNVILEYLEINPSFMDDEDIIDILTDLSDYCTHGYDTYDTFQSDFNKKLYTLIQKHNKVGLDLIIFPDTVSNLKEMHEYKETDPTVMNTLLKFDCSYTLGIFEMNILDETNYEKYIDTVKIHNANPVPIIAQFTAMFLEASHHKALNYGSSIFFDCLQRTFSNTYAWEDCEKLKQICKLKILTEYEIFYKFAENPKILKQMLSSNSLYKILLYDIPITENTINEAMKLYEDEQCLNDEILRNNIIKVFKYHKPDLFNVSHNDLILSMHRNGSIESYGKLLVGKYRVRNLKNIIVPSIKDIDRLIIAFKAGVDKIEKSMPRYLESQFSSNPLLKTKESKLKVIEELLKHKYICKTLFTKFDLKLKSNTICELIDNGYLNEVIAYWNVLETNPINDILTSMNDPYLLPTRNMCLILDKLLNEQVPSERQNQKILIRSDIFKKDNIANIKSKGWRIKIVSADLIIDKLNTLLCISKEKVLEFINENFYKFDTYLWVKIIEFLIKHNCTYMIFKPFILRWNDPKVKFDIKLLVLIDEFNEKVKNLDTEKDDVIRKLIMLCVSLGATLVNLNDTSFYHVVKTNNYALFRNINYIDQKKFYPDVFMQIIVQYGSMQFFDQLLSSIIKHTGKYSSIIKTSFINHKFDVDKFCFRWLKKYEVVNEAYSKDFINS